MPLRGIINALASYSLGAGGNRDLPLNTSSNNDVRLPAVKIQRLARADFHASRVYAEQGPLAVLSRNTRQISNTTTTFPIPASVTSEESDNNSDDSPTKNKRSAGSSSMKITNASYTCAEIHEWLLVLHENLLSDQSKAAGTDHMLCLIREQTASSHSNTEDSTNSATSLSTSETSTFPMIVRSKARNSIGERFVQLMTRLNEHLHVFQNLGKQIAFCLNESALRSLCESVAQHPHWSPLHVAAYHGWLEASRSASLMQYLNEPAISSDTGRGKLAVMLAIQQGHVEVVQALLEAGAHIHATDADGNTAFHYAARSLLPIMVEIVAGAVGKQPAQAGLNVSNLVNWLNIHGHSALYVAAHAKRCNKSRLLCEALMRAGASTCSNLTVAAGNGAHSHSSVVEIGKLLCKMFPDLLDVNAARNGGCVYHWSRSRDAVLKFVDLGIPLDDVDDQRSINKLSVVNDFGETALFCAVKCNRLDVCVTLLSNGAVIDARDRDGLTPLHVAVGCVTRHTSCNVVRCLIAFGADVSLKTVVKGVAADGSGKSAVNMARLIENENMRNEVLLILSVGRNVHKCAHFEDAELFVDKIRIEDMPGHSNNDMHLEYDYIERLICKFSGRKSPVNTTDARNSSSPHLTKYMAPKPPVNSSVRSLRVVNSVASKLRGKLRGSTGSSVSTDNDGKKSPPNSVTLPTVSASSVENVDQDCFHSGERLESVLCLDGGGIKGINHVIFLIELEERIGCSVVELFDWIVGTSTGGILAIMLARGLSLGQCFRTYLQVKDRVFRGKRPYSAQALELVLEEKMGHDTCMSQLQRPKLLIPACVADRHPPGVHFFSNLTNWTAYEQLVPRAETKKGRLSTLRQQLPPEQQIAWKAARSTGAAPTYFNSFEAYVDGGLVANNPTLDALAEILEYNHIQLTAGPAVLSSLSSELLNTVRSQQNGVEYDAVDDRKRTDEQSETKVPKGMKLQKRVNSSEKVKLSCVVSLGCGKGPVAAIEGIDLCRPETLWDVNTLATLAGNMNTMTRMIIEQATSTDGRQVSRARAWCRSLKVPYYRFTPRFSQHVSLDCTDDERLIRMMWEMRVYLKKQHKNIEQLVRLLQAKCHTAQKL